MKSARRRTGRASREDKLRRKFEKMELENLEKDSAMDTILPHAKDVVPYARKDLSQKLTRQLMAWSTRGNNVSVFKENCNTSPAALAQMAISSSFATIAFSVNQLGNSASYSAVFDQYRIRAAIITATPTINSNSTVATTTFMPRLYSVIDYDDATTPASINTLQQYDSCVVAPPMTAITRVLQPRMAVAAYGGGAFTSYANMEPQWIDFVSPSVQHYGVKFGVEGGTSGQTTLQYYEFECVLIVEMRNQR